MNDAADDAIAGGDERRRGVRTPTIRDVARLAGVSIGTASKALNANGRLSAETRAKSACGSQARSATGRTIWRRACTGRAR